MSILGKSSDLNVIFYNDISVRPYFDVEFQKTVDFSRKLKLDYMHTFLETNSDKIDYTKLSLIRLLKVLVNDTSDYWIINGWNHRASILTTVVGFFRLKKLVLRCEASDQFHSQPSKLRIFIDKLYLSMFTYYWTIGTHNEQFYITRNCNTKKIVHGHYSVEAVNNASCSEYLDEYNGEELRLLYVGKLTPRKRVLDLIKAFSLVAAETSNLSLTIVGDGELRDNVLSAAKSDTRIKFLGFQTQEQLYDTMARSDVFVIPSEREMWGLVVNEAMVGGNAIVSSDEVGSAIDLVREGVNGFVYKCGEINELANVLRNLCQLSPSTVINYKNNSELIISTWTNKRSVENLLQIVSRKV